VTIVVFSELVSVDRISCASDADPEHSRSERRGFSVESFDGRSWESVRGCDLDLVRSLRSPSGLDPRLCEELERDHSTCTVQDIDPLIASFGHGFRELRGTNPRDQFRSYELVLHRRRVNVWRDDGPIRKDIRDRVSLCLYRDRGPHGASSAPIRIDIPLRPRGSLTSLDWTRLVRDARRVAVSTIGPATPSKNAVLGIHGTRLDVVFEGGLGGVALHEACGHSLEADMAERGTPLTRRLGQHVAPDFVTLIDDPTLKHGFGSYSVDDEGQPAAPTPLIVEGRIERWLSSARYPGPGATASGFGGRRADYRSRAYPRMSNLVLEPGGASRADLLSGVDGRGLLVEALGIGGESNPHDGTFSLAVRRARLVEDGVLGRQVGPLILRGDSVGFLGGIAGIGRRTRFRPFVTLCEKHGQRVFTDAASPPMLVRRLAVRGPGSGFDRD
jgi:hypothetical protein